jgi:hypothetical protein
LNDALVLVHLVVRVLEVVIVILIFVVIRRVLLGSLGEVNNTASGAASNDIVQVDLLHIVLGVFVIV